MAAESTGMIEQSNQYNSVMPGLLGLAGTAIQAGVNWGINQENIKASKDLAEADRLANFQYGEQAADAADKRTRKLYEDYYSPQALVNQYRAAGMSPGILMGGTPGQGGHAGSQGSGAAGVQTSFVPYAPVSMLEAAQAAALLAQTEKTKAETQNISQDTKIKEIQTEYNEMAKNLYKIDFTIAQTFVNNDDGTQTSLFELADNFINFKDFADKVREIANKTDNEFLKNVISTEKGNENLRAIYMAGNRFKHDISVLSSEKVSSEFQEQIVKEMQKTEFKNLNAQAAVQYLKTNISTSELTEYQKEAWNNLIGRLENVNPTLRDVVIIIGSIINQAASNWHMPTIYNNTDQSVRTINIKK